MQPSTPTARVGGQKSGRPCEWIGSRWRPQWWCAVNNLDQGTSLPPRRCWAAVRQRYERQRAPPPPCCTSLVAGQLIWACRVSRSNEGGVDFLSIGNIKYDAQTQQLQGAARAQTSNKRGQRRASVINSLQTGSRARWGGWEVMKVLFYTHLQKLQFRRLPSRQSTAFHPFSAHTAQAVSG